MRIVFVCGIVFVLFLAPRLTAAEDCDAGYYSNRTLQANISCLKCPSGKWSSRTDSADIQSCNSCEGGKFSPILGATTLDACLPCESGKYANREGMSACSDCPEGRFVATSANLGCQPCPAGRFSHQYGSIACQDCTVGRWNNLSEQAACRECQLGKFGKETGASSETFCLGCPLGKFGSESGGDETVCEYCNDGHFSAQEGLTECLACAFGSYAQWPGMEECYVCPLGRWTHLAEENDYAGCVEWQGRQVSDPSWIYGDSKSVSVTINLSFSGQAAEIYERIDERQKDRFENEFVMMLANETNAEVLNATMLPLPGSAQSTAFMAWIDEPGTAANSIAFHLYSANFYAEVLAKIDNILEGNFAGDVVVSVNVQPSLLSVHKVDETTTQPPTAPAPAHSETTHPQTLETTNPPTAKLDSESRSFYLRLSAFGILVGCILMVVCRCNRTTDGTDSETGTESETDTDADRRRSQRGHPRLGTHVAAREVAYKQVPIKRSLSGRYDRGIIQGNMLICEGDDEEGTERIPIKRLGSNKISVDYDGETYTAELNHGQLVWNDGDIWRAVTADKFA